MKNELQKVLLRIGTFEAQTWAVEIEQRPSSAHPHRCLVRKPGSIAARHCRSTRLSR